MDYSRKKDIIKAESLFIAQGVSPGSQTHNKKALKGRHNVLLWFRR